MNHFHNIYITIATFTVIVRLVKHSDDVHWNVRTNEYIVIEEIINHLFRFLKND